MQWHVAHTGTCVDRTAAAMFISMAARHAPQCFGHLDVTALACHSDRLSREMTERQQCRPKEVSFISDLLPQNPHMQGLDP